MTVLRGSRYENVAFTGIKTVDGKTRKFLHDRRIFSRNDVGVDAIEHTMSGEETLDSVADHFYDDETLWWLIADVNDIEFLFDAGPGTRLVIPNPQIINQAPQ